MGWVVSVTPRPRFTPGERTPGTHCTGGWVGPRAGLDTADRGKILCPRRGSNPDRPVVQSVVRHYTDLANPAPVPGIIRFYKCYVCFRAPYAKIQPLTFPFDSLIPCFPTGTRVLWRARRLMGSAYRDLFTHARTPNSRTRQTLPYKQRWWQLGVVFIFDCVNTSRTLREDT
jgi:hypothetical protein